MALSREFANSLAANITYWRGRTSDTGDDNLRIIDQDRANLFRAVEFGLGLPDTYQDTAILIVQCYTFIVQRGYFREWIPIVAKMVSCCSDADLDVKGRLLDQLGIYYRRNRQLDAAAAAHLEEEQIGLLLADDSRIAFARMQLSSVFWRKRQYNKAEEYALSALEGFSRLEDSEEKIAGCLSNLGNIALDRGEHDLAEERFKQSITLYRQLDQPADLAATLKNISRVYEQKGNYDESLLALIEAADILAPTDYEIEKAAVEINIGMSYFRLGELDLAEAAFRRADTPFMRESGPVFNRALTANNMGNIYLAREMWDQAEMILLESVSLWKQARAQLNLANTLSGLAEAHVGKGELDEALQYYEEAIEIVAKNTEDSWAKKNAGRIYRE